MQYVSIVANNDLVPSWLIQNKPMWTCRLNYNTDQDESFDSFDYIAEPFLEQVLEPFGWHGVLVILDVCANVLANRHCDYEGYNIKSVYTLQVINKEDPSISTDKCDE